MKFKTIYDIPEKAKTLHRTVFEKPKMGIECFFIKLTPTKAIKVFPTLREAQYAQQHQTIAHRHRFAPKVLSKVKKCLVGNLIQYDKEAIFELDNGNFENRTHGYFYETQVAVHPVRFKEEEVVAIENKLRKLRWGDEDVHKGNVGRINGKLVLIDFGSATTTPR